MEDQAPELSSLQEAQNGIAKVCNVSLSMLVSNEMHYSMSSEKKQIFILFFKDLNCFCFLYQKWPVEQVLPNLISRCPNLLEDWEFLRLF